MPPQPLSVVRFYGNPEYAVESIGFKEIVLINPEKLNDPYDPPFFFATDFNGEYEILKDYIRQQHPKELSEFEERLPQEGWERFTRSIKKYNEDLRRSTFLFSTCGTSKDTHPKDNFYMWGHYGDGHRGVAIEFSTAHLTRAVLQKARELGGEQKDVDGVWWEINYTPDLPKIRSECIFQFVMNSVERSEQAWEGTGIFETLRLTVRSKSIEWKEENEWRLAWLNDETRVKVQRLPLLDDSVAAVFLGCRISAAVREDLIFETRRHFPSARMYAGKLAEGRFSLEFEEISLDIG